MASDNVFLTDTHAHLNLSPLRESVPQVIEAARAAGVGRIINIGIDIDSSKEAADISAQFKGAGMDLWFTAGIHPHEAGQVNDETLEVLSKLLRQDGAVALGEIGLDYYRDRSPRDVQHRAFEAQLELAARLDMPVVIHDRDAHEDLYAMLEKSVASTGIRGVFHCFSGDLPFARKVLDLGFLISVTGVVTFPKAQQLREVVAYLPKDRLLIETDSPFLSPVPFRGKTNQPAYVRYVAHAVADIRGEDFEEVARWTTENALALFAPEIRKASL